MADGEDIRKIVNISRWAITEGLRDNTRQATRAWHFNAHNWTMNCVEQKLGESTHRSSAAKNSALRINYASAWITRGYAYCVDTHTHLPAIFIVEPSGSIIMLVQTNNESRYSWNIDIFIGVQRFFYRDLFLLRTNDAAVHIVLKCTAIDRKLLRKAWRIKRNRNKQSCQINLQQLNGAR